VFVFGGLISFLVVALGQPARAGWLGSIAAACGYALFFYCLPARLSRRLRFFCGVTWFAAVQLVQLSWMTSIEFQGYYILGVYVFLSLAIGAQFGLLTLAIPRTLELSLSKILFIAALWTLLEWSRLHIVCGFSWNPVGLSLTHYATSLQFASLFGIYGLTFWVMLTNLLGLKALNMLRGGIPGVIQKLAARVRQSPGIEIGGGGDSIKLNTIPSPANSIAGAFTHPGSQFLNHSGYMFMRQGVAWAGVAAVPYVFGFVQLHYHGAQRENWNQTLDVALVQTSLLPSQKVPHSGRMEEFISPFEQWEKILTSLNQSQVLRWDMIVFPEAFVPLQAERAVYPCERVKERLVQEFGPEIQKCFPRLEYPYAEGRIVKGKPLYFVSNLFWCQTLSAWFGADVVAGLDHTDRVTKKSFNSVFCLGPGGGVPERYDKQVLLPLAEYLPLDVFRPLAGCYGIVEFFTKGEAAKVCGKKIPFSPSVCYEETFPGIMREGRTKGARLFVNVTNDNYYPESSLHVQHLFHARVRAVENGIPLIRSCNSGISAAIDSLGRVERAQDGEHSILSSRLSTYTYTTLYSFFGDGAVISLSLLFCMLYCGREMLSRKGFWFKRLRRFVFRGSFLD
jgi:apolipoprotein N-acyltransferase